MSLLTHYQHSKTSPQIFVTHLPRPQTRINFLPVFRCSLVIGWSSISGNVTWRLFHVTFYGQLYGFSGCHLFILEHRSLWFAWRNNFNSFRDMAEGCISEWCRSVSIFFLDYRLRDHFKCHKSLPVSCPDCYLNFIEWIPNKVKYIYGFIVLFVKFLW